MRMMSPASMTRSLSPRYMEVLRWEVRTPCTKWQPRSMWLLRNRAWTSPLPVTGADGGEDLEMGVVLDVGGLLQEGDLGGGLDPADGVHERGAVDEPGVGEEGLDLCPAGGVDVGGFHADFCIG